MLAQVTWLANAGPVLSDDDSESVPADGARATLLVAKAPASLAFSLDASRAATALGLEDL